MSIANKNMLSVTKGFWFVFEDGINAIVAGGSGISGNEYIYVNGNLVSEQKSYSKISKHSFEVDNNSYEVDFFVPEILKGKIECTLSKNNKAIKKYKTLYKYEFSFYKIFIYFLIVFGYAFSIIYYHLSAWSLIPFLVAMYTMGVVFTMSNIIFVEEDV